MRALLSRLNAFRRGDSGAVLVDWLVLVTVVIGTAVLVATVVGTPTRQVADVTAEVLATAPVGFGL